MRLLLPFCLVLTFIFMGFQCGHKKWVKYARDYEIQVKPTRINLEDDTLVFHLFIDAREKIIKQDETQTFELFVKSYSGVQKVADITVPIDRLVDVEIVQVLTLKKPVGSLQLRFKQYRSGKLRFVAPDLIIATIDDKR